MAGGVDAKPGEFIDVLQEHLSRYAGPIAKFIILKKIADLGEKPETFPKWKILELIDLCVDTAIYDPNLQQKARKEIKQELDRFLS